MTRSGKCENPVSHLGRLPGSFDHEEFFPRLDMERQCPICETECIRFIDCVDHSADIGPPQSSEPYDDRHHHTFRWLGLRKYVNPREMEWHPVAERLFRRCEYGIPVTQDGRIAIHIVTLRNFTTGGPNLRVRKPGCCEPVEEFTHKTGSRLSHGDHLLCFLRKSDHGKPTMKNRMITTSRMSCIRNVSVYGGTTVIREWLPISV